jgi:glycine cleavage system H lipoate-binding protein
MVEEINETLSDQPGLLNKAPQGNGTFIHPGSG